MKALPPRVNMEALKAPIFVGRRERTFRGIPKPKEKKCIFKRPSVIVVITLYTLLILPINDATVRLDINFSWCFFLPTQVEQNMLVNFWNHGAGIFWA